MRWGGRTEVHYGATGLCPVMVVFGNEVIVDHRGVEAKPESGCDVPKRKYRPPCPTERRENTSMRSSTTPRPRIRLAGTEMTAPVGGIGTVEGSGIAPVSKRVRMITWS
jgi:hypothetical protein